MPLYTSVKGPYTYQTVGDVVIEDGIYTRTSRTSTETVYLTQNYTIADSFEVCIKFKADQTEQEVYLFSTDDYGGTIRVQNNRLIGRVFPEWTYVSGLTINGMSTIQIGTTYWVRYIQTKTKAELYLSTDGKHFTSEGSITYTRTRNHTFSGKVRLGSYSYQSNNYNFIGEIDLNESYIKVNGIPWFGRSQARVRLNSGLAKYTKVGNPIIVDGILTANTYNTSDYISIPSLPTNFNKIELVIKYSYQKPETNNTYLYYSYATSNSGWLQLDLSSGGALECYISNNNNEVSAHPYMYPTNGAFSYNYAKVTMLGNQVYCSISTDGVNWIDGTSIEFSKASKYNLTLGKRVGKIAGNSIDLNESYIKLDGSYFWRGSDYYQNLNNYKIHQDNFSKYYTIVDGKLTWANPNIYLETDGNAYIKLPYKINSRTTFDIKAYCPPNKSNSWFFGAGVSYMQSSMILYEYSDNSNTTYFYYKAPYIDGKEDTSTGIRQGVKSNSGNPLTYKSYISNDKYFLDVVENGVTYQKTTTGWNIPSDLGHNIDYTGLFATFNTNTSVLSPHKSGIRIYKAKLWNNGINNFNLVPVPKGLLIGNFVVPSNGMFDIVTQTFYGNQGTGEFEIGGIPDDYIIEGGKMIWCNPNISLENNSNWTAYINTGIIPTDDMRFQTLSEVTDSASHDGCLLGCRTGSSASGKQFVLWYGNYSSTINSGSLVYGGSAAGKCNFNLGTLQKTQLDYNGTYFYCNGTQITPGIANVNKENYSTTLSIYLYGFRTNASGSIESRRFHGKVYEVALWSGSTILQYLVPVPKGILIGDKIAPSNCMFDLVTQTFFENKGTGEFTISGLSGDYIFIGDDVVWCNPNIYLRAKGTNNGGPQYIDTGLKLSNTSRVKVDFKFNVNSSWLFAADNNDDGYPRFGFIYSSGKHFAPVWYGANKAYEVGTSRFDKNTVDFNKVNVTLNKTEYTYSAFTNRDFTTTQTCYLFANHRREGSVDQSAQYDAQIYNCLMYNNDKLKRYFIPVTTNMQISGTTIPAPGMWDMVTKKYFQNKGTGSFTYGKDS